MTGLLWDLSSFYTPLVIFVFQSCVAAVNQVSASVPGFDQYRCGRIVRNQWLPDSSRQNGRGQTHCSILIGQFKSGRSAGEFIITLYCSADLSKSYNPCGQTAPE